ncbi:prmB [Symbiodinium natans]|uniref:PrmB protein n=1 Tax=Symbiodinium natans TaxID=878477 RepID=A0A812JCD7_9DINO|nr:prmB [Symbiodinium natans]
MVIECATVLASVAASRLIEKLLPTSENDEKTVDEMRHAMAKYFQQHGWELQKSPYFKHTLVIPQCKEQLSQVLLDPRLEGCRLLHDWLRLKFEEALNLPVDGHLIDHAFMCDHELKFSENVFGLISVKVAGMMDFSEFGKDTCLQVYGRVRDMGTTYERVAEELRDFDITGEFLQEGDFAPEDLQSFQNLPGLAKKRLRHHLARYKEKPTSALVVCIVACSLTMAYRGGVLQDIKESMFGEALKEKCVDYLKLRLAGEKPHEALMDGNDGMSTTPALQNDACNKAHREGMDLQERLRQLKQ